MKRKFFSDLIFLQLLNLLVKGVWILLIDRAVQNYLPAEDYVEYFVALNFSIFFIILLDFGLNNFNNREVSADRSFMDQNLFSILVLKLVLSVFTFGVAMAVGWLIGFSGRQLTLVGAMMLFQVIASMNLYLRSNISALHKFKLDGIFSVMDRFLVVIILSIPIFFAPELLDKLSVEGFVGVQIVGVLVTLVLLLVVNFANARRIDTRLHFSPIIKLVKDALPFAILAALMSVYTRIDAVMLNNLSSVRQVDHYAMSYRLLDAGNMFTLLLSGMLLPMFSRAIANKEPLNWLTNIASKLILVPGIVAVMVLFVWSEDLMTLMYPEKANADTGEVFSALIPSYIGFGLIFIFGTLLTAAKELRFLNTIAIISVVVNIVGNYFAIEAFGATGAAVLTVVTQLFFGLACFFKAAKEFELRVFKHEIFRLAGFFITMGAIIFFGKQYFNSPIVHVVITMITAIIIALVTGIIKPRDVVKVLRREKSPTT